MKNVTYLGLFWGMTFGLVAVALAQQPSPAPDQATLPPAAQAPDLTLQPNGLAPQTGAGEIQQNPAVFRNNRYSERGMPAPGAGSSRPTASGTYQPAQPAQPGQSVMVGGQPRGELGVWMAESGGPGVVIQRITRGSAAEQAGLREGDVILQVNGRDTTSPQTAAQMIRQIPLGQTAMLTISRDGRQQQLQVTIQAARERSREREMGSEMSHQVGFGGAEGAGSSDLATRTMRLEQQIGMLTQELQQMRQDMAQIRTGSTRMNTETTGPPAPPAGASPASPPPDFGKAEEKSAKAPADQSKPASPPAGTPPAGEKSGAAIPPSPNTAPPKTEEKPKAGTESKSGTETSDLFGK